MPRINLLPATSKPPGSAARRQWLRKGGLWGLTLVALGGAYAVGQSHANVLRAQVSELHTVVHSLQQTVAKGAKVKAQATTRIVAATETLQPSPSIEVEPKAPTPEPAHKPVGKRPPSTSYFSGNKTPRRQRSHQRVVEATELLDLDQYHLIGLITGTAHPKAMVEDPNGRGHVVRAGSRLGRNGGWVSRIDSSSIEVMELTYDPAGKPTRKPLTIKLPVSEFEDTVPN